MTVKTMHEKAISSLPDDSVLRSKLAEWPSLMAQNLGDAVQVNIQEVADYYFARYKPHLSDTVIPIWEVIQTFPILAPPWDNFFMSYKIPAWVAETPLENSKIRGANKPGDKHLSLGEMYEEVGIHFFGYEEEEPTKDHRWTLIGMGYAKWGPNFVKARRFTSPLFALPLFMLNEEGEPLIEKLPDGDSGLRMISITDDARENEDYKDIYFTDQEISIPMFIGPALMAITFIHAPRDAQLQEGLPSNRRRGRRRSEASNKRDWSRKYTVTIKGLKELTEYERNDSNSGIKKALHSVRGHFARYTEEAPLFGHYVGLVWKRPHLRGLQAVGIVEKDYEVVPGAEPEPE